MTYQRPESHILFNGKKYQTKIITHQGYRRIVKFLHATGEKIKDDTKLSGNHPKDCQFCGTEQGDCRT